MAIDTSSMSLEEISDLIQQLNSIFFQKQAQEKAEADERRQAVLDAISALENLLGPTAGDPGIESIRAVRRYDQQTMGDNSGLALELAFEGLEILTSTVLDIAHVIANQTKQ